MAIIHCHQGEDPWSTRGCGRVRPLTHVHTHCTTSVSVHTQSRPMRSRWHWPVTRSQQDHARKNSKKSESQLDTMKAQRQREASSLCLCYATQPRAVAVCEWSRMVNQARPTRTQLIASGNVAGTRDPIWVLWMWIERSDRIVVALRGAQCSGDNVTLAKLILERRPATDVL